MSKSNVKTEIKKAKRRSKCSRFIGLDCIGAYTFFILYLGAQRLEDD